MKHPVAPQMKRKVPAVAQVKEDISVAGGSCQVINEQGERMRNTVLQNVASHLE